MKTGLTLWTAAVFMAAALYGMDPSGFTVKPRGLSGRVYSQTHTSYRLCSHSEEFSLAESSAQKIRGIKRGGKSVCIEVVSGSGDSGCGRSEKYLAETAFLNYKSAPLKKQSALLAEEKDIIAAVEKFVHSRISDKRLGIPIIPADMVYEKRTGDCTEHAVLAAALLRGAGVPARAVVGVILEPEFMGVRNSFVFHMWVEACVQGRWITVDATRPGPKPLNRYIAMTFHSMKTAAPLDFIEAAAGINDLTIEYLGGW